MSDLQYITTYSAVDRGFYHPSFNDANTNLDLLESTHEMKKSVFCIQNTENEKKRIFGDSFSCFSLWILPTVETNKSRLIEKSQKGILNKVWAIEYDLIVIGFGPSKDPILDPVSVSYKHKLKDIINWNASQSKELHHQKNNLTRVMTVK